MLFFAICITKCSAFFFDSGVLMITLRQIEAFRAVMISGTVTQAANMLCVSQPAVSRVISDLEYRLGFKLFTRTKRQLVPTEEGWALYDEVERAFTGLQQISQTAAAIRQYHRGHLRLITFPSLASTLMVDLIARFVERYPEIAVSLEVQPSQRVFEWIVSQHCDLGLLSAPIANASVTGNTIATTNAVCILPSTHPLTANEVIRPEDLAGLPFISFKGDATFRHEVDDIFERASVVRDMKLEARSADGVCGLVAAGLGVSIIGPVISVDAFPSGLTVRPFEPEIKQELVLIHAANTPLSRLSEQFIEIVDEYMGQESPALALQDGVGIVPTIPRAGGKKKRDPAIRQET